LGELTYTSRMGVCLGPGFVGIVLGGLALTSIMQPPSSLDRCMNGVLQHLRHPPCLPRRLGNERSLAARTHARDYRMERTQWADRPSATVNRAANERLRAQPVAHRCNPVPAVRANPDSPHAEENWDAARPSSAEARRIGATFGQLAVFRVTATELAVLACHDNRGVQPGLG